MTFEYLLLIFLSLLPIAYKINFWSEIFWSDNTLQSKLKKWFSHFWSYIEFPLFFFSLTLFIEPLFEIFLYSFFFYFLVLYNIFVWGKIFRKKLPHTLQSWVLLFATVWIFLFLISLSHFVSKFLYLGIIWIFFIIPLFLSIKLFFFSRKSLE